jgi:hypothetical protein
MYLESLRISFGWKGMCSDEQVQTEDYGIYAGKIWDRPVFTLPHMGFSGSFGCHAGFSQQHHLFCCNHNSFLRIFQNAQPQHFKALRRKSEVPAV